MTTPKQSTTRKKSIKVPFNTERDVQQGTAVEGAPIVGGEFIIPDAKEGELAQGQTVEVRSNKSLQDDHGVGEEIIIRTFEFAANPEAFSTFKPTQQQIFDSHQNFIEAMLWQDGLRPAPDIQPAVIPNKGKYYIMVGARPSLGQVVLDTTQTLSQLTNASSKHSNKVPGSI